MNIAVTALPDRPGQEGHAVKQDRLRRDFHDAYDALRDRNGDRRAVGDCGLFQAHCRLVTFYEGRITRLERSLTNALASDALADEQRADIVMALHGTTARDVNLLSESERTHLDAYRAMDPKDRAAVRNVVTRLARVGGVR